MCSAGGEVWINGRMFAWMHNNNIVVHQLAFASYVVYYYSKRPQLFEGWLDEKNMIEIDKVAVALVAAGFRECTDLDVFDKLKTIIPVESRKRSIT